MNSTTSSTPVSPQVTDYLEYKAAMVLWRVFSPGLIVTGTLGNVMSIAVLTRKSMRQSTVSLYLVVLAVVDILVLYTGLLRQWLRVLQGTDLRNLHPLLCKVHVWMVYFSLDFSSWLLVAVTLERFVSVWFPHSVKRMCTRTTAGVIIAGIATFLLAVNSHFLYGLGDVVYRSGNSTSIQHCASLWSGYETFANTIWPWIDLCLFCLLPFLFLITGNVAIIVKVCISNRKRRRHDANIGLSNTQNIKVRSSKTSSMTVMLLTTNAVFLVCTSPISIFLIGEVYWFDYATLQPRGEAMYLLTWATVNVFMYTNNSINFLLYCISGSRFREALRGLFSRRRRIHPTASFTRNDNSMLQPTASQQAPERQEAEVTKKQVNLAVVGQDPRTDMSDI
ncbi:FMRFamide receptor-like [Gigantopelta aegis]|uniref:FMRFamide receptor-like n=1 Tax=Gigantopelta aegis TaxID=1735272 RepID=UPI001B88B30C|nr:FMRFamide receptor-like [Gigantopelta aegis]